MLLSWSSAWFTEGKIYRYFENLQIECSEGLFWIVLYPTATPEEKIATLINYSFFDRFRVGNIPGMSVVFVASKSKVSKSVDMMQDN